MGGLSLTNPGIQYDPNQSIDPNTGLPIGVAPKVAFFKNKAARDQQYLSDTASAAANAPLTIDSQTGEPIMGQPKMPREVNPSFTQLASPNPDTGQTPQISPAETKLGKLLHVVTAAARGAAMGSGQPNFGAGFEQAQVRPLQIASMRQGIAQQQAQTALTREQSNMVQTPYGPMPLGIAKMIFPAMVRAGAQRDVATTNAGSRKDVATINADSRETIASDKLGAAAPHTINTPSGTLQWDPEAKNYKKIAEPMQGKMGSVQPEIYAQLGAPPLNDPEKLKAWGSAAEAIKTRMATAGAGARGQAYGAFKPVQVLDPESGELKWAYAGQAIGEGAAPAEAGTKAMSKQQQFQEIHYASGQMRQAVNGLDKPFSAPQIAKLTLAMSHSDPTVRNNLISTMLGSQELTPAQQNFVIWANQLNERALSLRNIAGMGQGAQDLRSAIQNTLPGIRSGSNEMALKQLDAFDNQVNMLEKGIPKVKSPNSPKPTQNFKSVQDRDKALGVVYAH